MELIERIEQLFEITQKDKGIHSYWITADYDVVEVEDNDAHGNTVVDDPEPFNIEDVYSGIEEYEEAAIAAGNIKVTVMNGTLTAVSRDKSNSVLDAISQFAGIKNIIWLAGKQTLEGSLEELRDRI